MHERIAIHTSPTEGAEAEFVVAEIERLVGGHSFFSIDSGRGRGTERPTLGFGDFAILYRTASQSAALIEALQRSGMPFSTGGHRALAENEAVVAILRELEALSANRPLRELLSDTAQQVSTAFDAGVRGEALRWLSELAEQTGGDRERFREAVALASEADFVDPRANRISLLTMHAAKGLEFAVVFIVGLEDGIVPLRFGAERETAEERRLFYVAMTRAKDLLFLSRAVMRVWRGKPRQLEASPFLRDIEAELLAQAQSALPKRRHRAEQLALL
jgi:DNA helicase-2/ATP-dependent DNA helicase PcrA